MSALKSMDQHKFKTLAYLQEGSVRQRAAYACLAQLQLWKVLHAQNPLLVGTIPISIDGPESDLDVIGQAMDLEYQAIRLQQYYSAFANYQSKQKIIGGIPCLVVTFKAYGFPIEVFLQNIPSHQQDAYRHLLIEHRLLQERGTVFREQVINLKQQGLKTEPAFAQLLGLEGDPYEALLQLEEAYPNSTIVNPSPPWLGSGW